MRISCCALDFTQAVTQAVLTAHLARFSEFETSNILPSNIWNRLN